MTTIPYRLVQACQRTVIALGGLLLAAGCANESASTGHHPKLPAAAYTPCQPNLDAQLPIITCQPLDQTNALGAHVVFQVTAVGPGSLTYQWYHAGPTNSEFLAIEGGNQRRLIINGVTKNDYGMYFCVIASEYSDDELPIVTQTRMAELGGRRSTGAGGPFAATQYPVANSTTTSICNTPVSGRWVRFPGTQKPDAGMNRFEGRLVNITSNNIVINHNDYLLQWWVTSINTQCCDIIPDNPGGTPPVINDVGYSPVYSTNSYRFIAHFKPGKAPPVGNVIELRGDWLP